jgi:hypothetical protein
VTLLLWARFGLIAMLAGTAAMLVWLAWEGAREERRPDEKERA